MAKQTRRWLRLALLLAVVGSTLTLFPRPAYACSCIETTLEEQADELHYAFVGHQIGREQIDGMADNGVRLVFEVDRVYKGEVTTPFEVFTHAQESACGVSFNNAQTGVVAYKWQGKPSAGLCSQLMDTSEAQMNAVFGDGVVPAAVPLDQPEADDSPPWLWLILAGAVGSVAALAFVARQAQSRDA
jgi:hypothetical protein